MRLAEAITLIRLLWTQERVDFQGDYYEVSRATIYDRPEQPVPIFVAASGPLAAKLAGRVGDGFICTSGKDPELYRTLLGKVHEGAEAAGRDPSAIRRQIEVKVSYDRDLDYAYKACHWWAALALAPEQKEGVEDAIEMERLADANADNAHTRFIVSDDPQDVVERIGAYLDLGFEDLVIHAPGADQLRFLEQFTQDVLPALRERAAQPARSVLLEDRREHLQRPARGARRARATSASASPLRSALHDPAVRLDRPPALRPASCSTSRGRPRSNPRAGGSGASRAPGRATRRPRSGSADWHRAPPRRRRRRLRRRSPSRPLRCARSASSSSAGSARLTARSSRTRRSS